MAKWMNGVPVPGVWTRSYNNGWSANCELTTAGHWRAVVMDQGMKEVTSAACVDLADAKNTAIILYGESRREYRNYIAKAQGGK